MTENKGIDYGTVFGLPIGIIAVAAFLVTPQLQQFAIGAILITPIISGVFVYCRRLSHSQLSTTERGFFTGFTASSALAGFVTLMLFNVIVPKLSTFFAKFPFT